MIRLVISVYSVYSVDFKGVLNRYAKPLNLAYVLCYTIKQPTGKSASGVAAMAALLFRHAVPSAVNAFSAHFDDRR